MSLAKWRPALVAVALAVAASRDAAASTTYRLSATLRSFDSRAPAMLGSSVAVLGGQVAAGSPGDDLGVPGSGAARLFRADLLNHVFMNPTPATGDQFGASLSTVGAGPIPTLLVIGAPGVDTGGSNAGAAYLFDGDENAGTFTQCLRALRAPAPHDDDRLGTTVAGVGSAAFVGAPGDDTKGLNAGAVYVFDASPGAGGCAETSPTAVIYSPVPVAGEQFGTAAAAIGARLAVGAPFSSGHAPSAGIVYLLGFDGGLIRALEKEHPAAGDLFGLAVAIAPKSSGADPASVNVLVGAPLADAGGTTPDVGAAYLFDGETGQLLRTFSKGAPSTGDLFGASVAFAQNATQVLVGAPGDSAFGAGAGAVYLFDAQSGALLQTFPNPIPAAGDRFGAAVVARNTDVVVGAPGATNIVLFPSVPPVPSAGAVYVFTFCGAGCPTGCRNGIVEPDPQALFSEQCDDANFDEGDGCRDCQLPVCGDGVRDPGESCDEWDASECPQGCQADCTCTPVCGQTFQRATVGAAIEEGGAKCNCASPPPNGTLCNDGDQCTYATCNDGSCVVQNPIEVDIAMKCGPSVACRIVKGCDSKTGCIYERHPSVCDDHDPCTRDACDPPNGDQTGCVHVRQPGCCQDCETPTGNCEARVECVACLLCDQVTSPCCAAVATCQTVQPRAGDACDDHDSCTVGDSCDDGVCQGAPVTCIPGECQTSGACVDGTCSFQRSPECNCAVDGDCDDLNVCTRDTCVGGICHYDPTAGSCDDGNGCSVDDACVNKVCMSVAVDFDRTSSTIAEGLHESACPSLPARVSNPLAAGVDLVARAKTKGPKGKRRLLRMADKKLRAADHVVAHAHRLAGACADALRATITEAKMRVDCLRHPL